ncbi:ATP-dependent helicase HrpB [Stackebrandtia endophytica]|uniref:ATP-dependent helicase HrpB n=1 Tax=Stackebrandtia endophytica TaxID=1496996 RepID=A0A543AQ43_9ACTN|nr:ATP-dependent helicase HrpB [Stackebrandtia endophytica]TQL74684.1 ATP-dependent helicase HrpB [Stackebrandtia endophytica]
MLPDVDLPVRTILPTLCDTLSENGAAVLVAPPGTGKTSLVPLALADAFEGRILVAEPRRIATRAAAARMAELTGTRLGDLVGYTVRGERRVSAATKIEVVTTGVLVRRLHNDPELSDVGAVVIDECHERHLDTDLAASFLTDVRMNLRDDLLILATSATARATELAALLGGETAPVPILEVAAASHPLDVRWCPPPRPAMVEGLRVDDALLDHVARVTSRAVGEQTGDVLVFLPGAAEIERVARRLSTVDVDVLRLHGRQSSSDQDAALRSSSRRRVVLATAVAESSLTVPGVRVVVDAGLSRQPRMDHARGMGSLVTVRVSQDSATQRAGRAARLGPGAVYRCWSQAEHDRLPRHAPAEVLTADLADFMLQLSAWGAPGGDGLPLLDRPPEGGAAAATRTLRWLGAVEESGKITNRGSAMAKIGAHPRLARALLDGAAAVGADRAAAIVATLAEPTRRGDDDVHAVWRRLRRDRTSRWHREVERLRRLAPSSGGSAADRPTDDQAAALVVGLSYPEWVGRRRNPDSRDYLLASGTAAQLSPESALTGVEWLVVAQAVRQPGQAVASIRLAAATDADTARDTAASLLARSDEVTWANGDVRAERVERLGAITLETSPLRRPAPEAVAAALADGLAGEGLALLNFTPAATNLRARIEFCRHTFGPQWPDVSTDTLRATVTDWLGPQLATARKRADLTRIDIVAALRRLLDWRQLGELDRVAPPRLTIPSGSPVTVDYTDPAAPTVRAKLQEFFGTDVTPTVADGRVPVVLHLLSPAGRPAAVTADLSSFWRQGYPSVRSELRGRYPRHPWPTDPAQAQPTRHTTRRSRS